MKTGQADYLAVWSQNGHEAHTPERGVYDLHQICNHVHEYNKIHRLLIGKFVPSVVVDPNDDHDQSL
jgi:hypothetical protein